MNVFISYAHASDTHKIWVRKLATALRRKSIHVTLDQDDLRLGQVIEQFQRQGISTSGRVLIICSDAYVAKCDTDWESGARQEKELMRIEMAASTGTIKFIPVLRDNLTRKMPSCLIGRLWLDATDDKYFANTVQRLVSEISRT